jgi:hypothetical protein
MEHDHVGAVGAAARRCPPSQRNWRCGRSRSPRWGRCFSRSPRHGSAVSLARFPIGWLTTPNRAFVGFVFVLALLVPTIVSTAICYSVASTDEGPARRFG